MPQPEGAAATGVRAASRRAPFEVADVVREYGGDLGGMSARERAVLRAIGRCRTAALGGHVEACRSCGHERVAYNSCRNRHCPKCQGRERARWLAAERAMLLPVAYFHVVFTLPDALRPVVRANRRRLCDLLFRAAAATLQEFSRDARHLGGDPAITMVLHTWGQTLVEHFHVHCIVSGGGLSADGRSWRRLRHRRRPFLFPVRALSVVFRAKYLAGLDALRARGQLRRLDAERPARESWLGLRAELRKKPWVVYSKPPFGGPERVLKYLSRYTHRVAISNHRLTYVGQGIVRFRYMDYADAGREKEMTLGASEFLRRFLLHVLPKGFMRVRHYGLLANCQRRRKLARARELLTEPEPRPAVPEAAPDAHERTDRRTSCPVCGGDMATVYVLTAGASQIPGSTFADSS